VRGRLDALLVLTGNSVETLHPMEIPHAWQVFYFRLMQGFHDNGLPGTGGRAVNGRAVPK